ncbi:MAG TPA: SH3 domain-containing protein [Alphaproteobacteria bacterium]|nr:SH3 domain-containing protein [Alphaproteobacteria bacterium]
MLSAIRGAALAAIAWLLWVAAPAAEEPRKPPYFVSLGASEVNLRTGPGVRYPIDWVYRRRALPVEVIGIFDHWRQIRDWQGTEGWVHQNMLSQRRTVIVVGERRTLRREPDPASLAVAAVDPGVVGTIRSCEEGWCRIEIGGRTGWLAHQEFWGTYPAEPID